MNPLRVRLWTNRLRDEPYEKVAGDVITAWRAGELSSDEAEAITDAIVAERRSTSAQREKP